MSEQEFDGRIGPKMEAAVSLTESKGGYPSRLPLAVAVGPHGSTDYGYQIVNRCIRRGLLALDPDHPEATPQGSGAVVVTDKGRSFLDERGGWE